LIRAGPVTAGQRIARGEGARSDDLAGLDQLRRREDVLRPHRRIEIGRHAIGEVYGDLVVVLGPHPTPLAVMVRVHVDPTWNDRLAPCVDDAIDASRAARADTGDATAANDDRAAVDDLAMIERHEARARQSDAARRGGTRDADAERHRIGRARIDVPNEELIGAPEFEGVLVAPAGEQAAVPRETRHRQLAALLVDTNRL